MVNARGQLGLRRFNVLHLLDRILDKSCQRRVVLRRVHHDQRCPKIDAGLAPFPRTAPSGTRHQDVPRTPLKKTGSAASALDLRLTERQILHLVGVPTISSLSAVLDSGHRFGIPCVSLFSVRLQFLTRGSGVTIEILVYGLLLLVLFKVIFFAMSCKECHNSPDGVHVVVPESQPLVVVVQSVAFKLHHSSCEVTLVPSSPVQSWFSEPMICI